MILYVEVLTYNDGGSMQQRHKRDKLKHKQKIFSFSLHDFLILVCVMGIATIVCALLRLIDVYESSNISLIYVLAALVTARLTSGYFWGFAATVIGVFGVNYVFTYPYFAFNFTLAGYPLTFLLMFAASFSTSTLTSRIKLQEEMRLDIEKEKAKANLLRAVSHDLRTPLTSIVGATSVVVDNEENLSSEKKKELLNEVISEAKWLIQMVENLLSITRFADQDTSITKTEEAAEEVLSEVVRKFRQRFPGTKISVEVPNELILVPMDAILIEQVLNNLLENAVLHGGTVSEIILRLFESENCVGFSVADNGKGISPDLLPHIFEGYYWHENQLKINDTKSMGIGLPVCKTIVEAHGGHIVAENQPEGGAKFTFYLPLQ